MQAKAVHMAQKGRQMDKEQAKAEVSMVPDQISSVAMVKKFK